MRHHHLGDGAFVVRLDPGDEILASLTRVAEEHDIMAGHVMGLGAVDRLVLALLDPATGEYERRKFEEPMEVGHLMGTFSMDGDRPFVHVHAVVAPRELLAYAGHVMEARVSVSMELFVRRLPGRLDRQEIEGQSLKRLQLPGETPAEAEEGDDGR
jgi:predicted DNA-binding protein with PD1-like motif